MNGCGCDCEREKRDPLEKKQNAKYYPEKPKKCLSIAKKGGRERERTKSKFDNEIKALTRSKKFQQKRLTKWNKSWPLIPHLYIMRSK